VRALLTAAFLLTTLLFAAHPATAAPPTPADPPDLLTPSDPPSPQPCEASPVPCDITLTTLTAGTPTRDLPPAPTTTQPPDSTAPADGTTDEGTAAGRDRRSSPVSPPAPAGTNWWLLTIPVLALLALAAAGAVLLIQRSERRPH